MEENFVEDVTQEDTTMVNETNTESPVAWLRDAHNGNGDECLVPCAKGDPGGFPVFIERDNLKQEVERLREALDRVTTHLESWRRDDTDGQATAETEACIYCARAALRTGG